MKRIGRVALWMVQIVLLMVCVAAIVLWALSERGGPAFESCDEYEKPGEKQCHYVYFAAVSGAVWFGRDRVRFDRHDLGGIGQGLQTGPTTLGTSAPFRGGLIAPWNLTNGKLSARGRLAWWRDGGKGTWGDFSDWAIAALGCCAGKRSGACNGDWSSDQAKNAASPARQGGALQTLWIRPASDAREVPGMWIRAGRGGWDSSGRITAIITLNMFRRLDYALVRNEQAILPAGRRTPLLAALGFVVMSAVGWVFFFVSGSATALRTHRIDRGQDQRLVRFTPWRREAPGVMMREGVLILAMHRLWYRQETRDGGRTKETVKQVAEVRWGPASVGLVGSGILAGVVYFGLKRAGRVERWR